jgi:hypothetical protein
MINWDLERIFQEAIEDRKSIVTKFSKGMSVINNGIKFLQFPDRIEIMNMGKGGDYFKELTAQEYDFFYDDGLEAGCIQVAINNCLHKLKIIEENIKTEVNTRKNDKHIQNLKNRREVILNKFTNHKIKLNKLKSNQNG